MPAPRPDQDWVELVEDAVRKKSEAQLLDAHREAIRKQDDERRIAELTRLIQEAERKYLPPPMPRGPRGSGSGGPGGWIPNPKNLVTSVKCEGCGKPIAVPGDDPPSKGIVCDECMAIVKDALREQRGEKDAPKTDRILDAYDRAA